MKKILAVLVILAILSIPVMGFAKEKTEVQKIEKQIKTIIGFQNALKQKISNARAFIKNAELEIAKCSGRIEVLMFMLEKAIEKAQTIDVDELEKQRIFQRENLKSIKPI